MRELTTIDFGIAVGNICVLHFIYSILNYHGLLIVFYTFLMNKLVINSRHFFIKCVQFITSTFRVPTYGGCKS